VNHSGTRSNSSFNATIARVERTLGADRAISTVIPPTAVDLLTREDRFEAVYSVAIPLGLRQGEILGLRWDDLDLDAKQMRVQSQLQFVKGTGFVFKEPKWHSRRTISLPS